MTLRWAFPWSTERRPLDRLELLALGEADAKARLLASDGNDVWLSHAWDAAYAALWQEATERARGWSAGIEGRREWNAAVKRRRAEDLDHAAWVAAHRHLICED